MDLKKSSITADILNILSDCKVHTLQEIADEVEVSKMTVRRHIQSLSYRYPIQTFSGGINRGGVYLDKNYLYQGQMLTRDELQVINKALAMLQNSKGDDVSQEIIINLISKFSLPSNKEYIDDEYCKRIG
ncbi:MAG: HTH domain-containing protein [Clostridia bacterium]|nr:HTH domain-containing protein [Clostridia bacterium]